MARRTQPALLCCPAAHACKAEHPLFCERRNEGFGCLDPTFWSSRGHPRASERVTERLNYGRSSNDTQAMQHRERKQAMWMLKTDRAFRINAVIFQWSRLRSGSRSPSNELLNVTLLFLKSLSVEKLCLVDGNLPAGSMRKTQGVRCRPTALLPQQRTSADSSLASRCSILLEVPELLNLPSEGTAHVLLGIHNTYIM